MGAEGPRGAGQDPRQVGVAEGEQRSYLGDGAAHHSQSALKPPAECTCKSAFSEGRVETEIQGARSLCSDGGAVPSNLFSLLKLEVHCQPPHAWGFQMRQKPFTLQRRGEKFQEVTSIFKNPRYSPRNQ